MRRLLPDPAPSGDTLDDHAALGAAYRLPPGRSVLVDFVVSIDGAIAVEGRSAGLGSPGDRRVFQVLRALADAVLVGHGTAAAEGYRPVAAEPELVRLRASLGRPAEAPVVVVSRRAALAAGVVDELDLSVSPALVGGEGRLVTDALPGVVRPRLLQVLEEDGVLFTRYAVDR